MERQPQAYCNGHRHHGRDGEEKHPGEDRVDDECNKKGGNDRANLRGAGSCQRAELPEHHCLHQQKGADDHAEPIAGSLTVWPTQWYDSARAGGRRG